MCGFAGVIAWDERYRVSRETLAKMSAAIAHRGPDGEGTYFSPDAEITPDQPQVALAHRRLAIIDPDPRGNQPFTDGEGRWLVYNGEIYNYRELRAELKALKPEYQWRTDCDTEVLLVAYDVWGEKCVEHFNGMFAFAIWDGVKKELFLGRDRMGQKPLYGSSLAEHGRLKAVAFGSETAVFDGIHWVRRDISSGGLLHYLRFGYGHGGIYRGLWQIDPGTTWSTGDYDEPTPYFLLGWTKGTHAENHVVTRTRELVQQAVKRQLVSDVPVGCLLSGGIDSSVIAAAMVKLRGSATGVQTFSISFTDPRYDESAYAMAVAEHLGTTHRSFVVHPEAAEDLPKLARAFGEPFADSSALPTHYLAREVRRHVKVALSGDGGDELFGGYDRYRAMWLGMTARRMPKALLRTLAGPVTAGLPSGHPKARLSKLKRFLGSLNLSPGLRYESYLRLFDEPTIDELLGPPPRTPPKSVSRFALEYNEFLTDRDEVRAALAVDRETYLPDDLLTKVDRASMLHALEVRSPFMDHELVQFAAGLTTDQLLKGGPKRMLREAFADDLPSWVFKRKKMGFAVPIGDWFRAELRPMLHDHLFAADSFGATHFNMPVVRRLVDEHERFKVDHSQRLYALLMLELWWKTSR